MNPFVEVSPYVAVVLVNIATSFFKKWVYPKFGASGVQIILGVFSLIAAFVLYYAGVNENFQHILKITVQIFVSAMVFYEVILKKFSFFSSHGEEDAPVEDVE